LSALVSLGRAIRELDQFLADLDAAGLLDSPEWAPVAADIRRHRRMAYEAIREAAPGEA
jgi:hypothetical protein